MFLLSRYLRAGIQQGQDTHPPDQHCITILLGWFAGDDKGFTRFSKTGKEIKGERKKSYYLFEDVTLRAEEEITLKKHDKGKISKEEIEKGLKKAGKILIISDLENQRISS